MTIQPAFADSVSFIEDVRCVAPQPGCDVTSPVFDVEQNILTPLGMTTGDETLATVFSTPLDPAQPTEPSDLTFTFMRDTGIFVFSFGFCFASDVTADPVLNPQLFAEQCLGNATEIFDDTGAVPGTDSSTPTPLTCSTKS